MRTRLVVAPPEPLWWSSSRPRGRLLLTLTGYDTLVAETAFCAVIEKAYEIE